ncbi:UDP-glucose 4-epimerase [Pyrodictium occultum]|uniref:UDP-glucose 4-epimerase n=1 Tax=Pyrodictium occultum TaxID=2309 RepID=A0A0V8RRV7_PYROC|nr:SDR family NAD(P)-dependent oxidoreductase [Pyrodictium occultum]KSW10766.1 UDP-glucose 4-epimerase [Pyrodictium occultum]
MRGKALITGGAGFIGSHLVDRLLKEGWAVRVVDNFSSGRYSNLAHHRDNPMLEIIRGDLKDAETSMRVVEGVDVVFHYAANPEVRVSTTNPDIHFNENVVATFNLLEAMRKKDIRKLVFASSSSVYGEPEKIPVSENAPIKPVSVYGASKAACESLIHAYSKLYGIKSVVLRYANVVGPRLRHGIIYDIIQKLRKNPRRLEVLGDGTQVRSYIYITDAIEATMLTFKNMNDYFEVYNIGNEDWITVDEVVNVIIKVMGLSNVEIIHKPIAHGVGWPGDVKRIALSIEKLKSLGFKPRMNSIESVKEAAKHVANEP